jgi:hypothetical protein
MTVLDSQGFSLYGFPSGLAQCQFETIVLHYSLFSPTFRRQSEGTWDGGEAMSLRGVWQSLIGPGGRGFLPI